MFRPSRRHALTHARNRLHWTRRRSAIAVGVTALLLGALAPIRGLPAYASPTPSPSSACVNGLNSINLRWTVSKDRTTITVKPAHRLCKPVTVVWGSYTVPATWDRKVFDATAVPQHLFASVTGTLSGTSSITLKVALPSCGNVQVDLYYPPVVPTVASSSHFGVRIGYQLIASWLWHESTCVPTTEVQHIRIVVPVQGGLFVSTPYTSANPLDLGQQILNEAGTQYSASGEFEGLSVIDTRNTDLPWTVTAQATDLRNGINGVIDSQNVGLTNLVAALVPGDTLTAADVTATDNPAADPAVTPGTPGSQGLGGIIAHTVLFAPKGLGSIGYNGLLTINAPTSTPAGLYAGTITITII
jgi:hypothetical protein